MLKHLKDPQKYIGLGVWFWDSNRIDPDPVKMPISRIELSYFKDKNGNIDYFVSNVILGKNGRYSFKPQFVFMSKKDCSESILREYDKKISSMSREISNVGINVKAMSEYFAKLKNDHEKACDLKSKLEEKISKM